MEIQKTWIDANGRFNNLTTTSIIHPQPPTPKTSYFDTLQSSDGRLGKSDYDETVNLSNEVSHGSQKCPTSSVATMESSPCSADGEEEEMKKKNSVKRACNECRQQKLRCDVIQDPYTSCTRCLKYRIECRVDSNFKRIGKRSRYAELERSKQELEVKVAKLEKRLSELTNSAEISSLDISPFTSCFDNQASRENSYVENVNQSQQQQRQQQHHHHHHHAHIHHQQTPTKQAIPDMPTDFLEAGFDSIHAQIHPSPDQRIKFLGDIVLNPDQVNEFFEEYFAHYHEFLPLLDQSKSPDHYYEKSPLLFWTIIAIAARHFSRYPNFLSQMISPYNHLVWYTMSKVPQSHYAVKALCLLCTWPLPSSSTSSDPTFMYGGLMMKIAEQIGLHRPFNAHEFTKNSGEVCNEDVKDLIKTWAICNIVSQSLSTGFGQPSEVVFDATLDFENLPISAYPLPDPLAQRLQLEKFCHRVTQILYGYNKENDSLFGEKQDSVKVNMLSQALNGLEVRLGIISCPWIHIYIHSIRLHLRLHTFFDSPMSPSYLADLRNLYDTSAKFLEVALQNEVSGLKYATHYIMQMILAAGFALMKLLNSVFVVSINREHGRNLFYATIRAIRSMSITHNDLPQRLAEVLVQLWKANGAGFNNYDTIVYPSISDASLQLKVRHRMSMSLLYDSVWKWREESQGKIRQVVMNYSIKNPSSPGNSRFHENSSTASASLVPSQNINQSDNQHPDTTKLSHTFTQDNGYPYPSNLLSVDSPVTPDVQIINPVHWFLEDTSDTIWPALPNT